MPPSVLRTRLPWLALALWCAALVAEADDVPQAPVRLHDSVVFTLRRGDGARSAEERARAASKALTEAAAHSAPEDVRITPRGDVATLMVGATPIVNLTAEDAALSGDATVDVLSARLASSVREAVRKERQRSQIAASVFAVSLVVFFGLVTLYLVRKLQEFATRARAFVHAHPERIPSLHISSLEVLGSAPLRALIVVSLGVGRWLGALGLFYAWLVLSLSLFDETRPYTEKLTFAVVSPLSALVSRLATALPILVIALFALGALLVVLRIVSLFFASVERREVHFSWVRPDLAQATGALVQLALVVGSLVFAAPLITGDSEGPLSRIGLLAVFALALGCAPLLASSAVGLSILFSRGLSVGDLAEYGGERGTVQAIGLTTLTLQGEDGSIVRVPHLRALWHPTRLYPGTRG